MDTDAAGIWHHSLIIRWAEEAEAELHRSLGIIDETFGATPRVRTEFEFASPLRFEDEVDIRFSVTDLGDTSITYGIAVDSAGETVVKGRMVAVFIDRESGAKRRWPDHMRIALSPEGGS